MKSKYKVDSILISSQLILRTVRKVVPLCLIFFFPNFCCFNKRWITILYYYFIISSVVALPFNISDIVEASNYTNNELCYIKYHGISIRDNQGIKGYGIWNFTNGIAVPLLSPVGYTKTVGTKDNFTSLVAQYGIYIYDPSVDYCTVLEEALYKKYLIQKAYIDKHGYLPNCG